MHQQFGKGSAMGSSVVVLAFLLVVVVVVGAGARPRLRYAHHDALFVARCEARCWLEDDKSSVSELSLFLRTNRLFPLSRRFGGEREEKIRLNSDRPS